jgi:hypothetical protein
VRDVADKILGKEENMKRVAPLVLALGLGWGQQAVGLCQHGALTSVRLQVSLPTHRFMHRYLAPSKAG